MKAISIKQPWASLIAHGIKDIENRTWKCPQKYIGKRVLIHASSSKPVFRYSFLQYDIIRRKSQSLIFKKEVNKLKDDATFYHTQWGKEIDLCKDLKRELEYAKKRKWWMIWSL